MGRSGRPRPEVRPQECRNRSHVGDVRESNLVRADPEGRDGLCVRRKRHPTDLSKGNFSVQLLDKQLVWFNELKCLLRKISLAFYFLQV